MVALDLSYNDIQRIETVGHGPEQVLATPPRRLPMLRVESATPARPWRVETTRHGPEPVLAMPPRRLPMPRDFSERPWRVETSAALGAVLTQPAQPAACLCSAALGAALTPATQFATDKLII